MPVRASVLVSVTAAVTFFTRYRSKFGLISKLFADNTKTDRLTSDSERGQSRSLGTIDLLKQCVLILVTCKVTNLQNTGVHTQLGKNVMQKA